jgi:peroxiredoxin
MKRCLQTIGLFLILGSAGAQSLPATGQWRGSLHRADGQDIVFSFEWKQQNGKPLWVIRNAGERIQVTDIKQVGDSLIVQMPVFESQFRLKYSNGMLEGVWIKGGALRNQVLPFTATPGAARFAVAATPQKNITGRWATVFTKNNLSTAAIAEFKQQGSHLTGTFLTPTGDYRYLEGVVRNDSLLLSCFDGSHAYFFMAVIDNNKAIKNGIYFSGAVFSEEWTAVKDPKASLPTELSAIYLKPGEERLNFTFNDLNGKPVSINDERFKNKVVVVQLMGSWCPNCMDEIAFLSDYYIKNKQRGVEIVSLAYEYTTDTERSLKSLRKFQQKFNVQYPMLLTGVTANDTLRTEKTLPQITPIRFFPSSIIIDKKGKVRKFETGFNGPGTGEHYTAFKKEFEATIDGLLKEN